MDAAPATDYASYEDLFGFLYPRSSTVNARPRYTLHPPDLHELRWSVWDTQLRRTLSYGVCAEAATTAAIEAVRKQLPPLTP